jgi:hypothetical protein
VNTCNRVEGRKEGSKGGSNTRGGHICVLFSDTQPCGSAYVFLQMRENEKKFGLDVPTIGYCIAASACDTVLGSTYPIVSMALFLTVWYERWRRQKKISVYILIVAHTNNPGWAKCGPSSQLSSLSLAEFRSFDVPSIKFSEGLHATIGTKTIDIRLKGIG